MNEITSHRRDPGVLLSEIHAALDLIERNLNHLPWRADTGSHIDLVVQLRNRVIATYPHENRLAPDTADVLVTGPPPVTSGSEP